MEEAVAQDDEEQEDHHAEDQGDAAEGSFGPVVNHGHASWPALI